MRRHEFDGLIPSQIWVWHILPIIRWRNPKKSSPGANGCHWGATGVPLGCYGVLRGATGCYWVVLGTARYYCTLDQKTTSYLSGW